MYITLEGPEATGKSTHAQILSSSLTKMGYDVLLTKEPGSPHDNVCVAIRKILLDPNYIIADRAALLMFLADRAQHMEKISVALATGKIVISDRSSLSTYVYHTAREREYFLESDKELCAMLDFAQQIRPDVGLIFNANLEWSLSQLNARGALDRIEQFGEAFHLRTRILFTEPQISALVKVLTKAPKDITYVPDTSGHTTAELADFILNKITQNLECE
jgi:dTMP kinase